MQVPGGELPRSRLSSSRIALKTNSFGQIKYGLGLHGESFVVLRLSCCVRSSGLGCKEGFDVGDGIGDAVGRKRLEEYLAVALAGDAGIEEDENAAVFERAN